MAMRKPKLTWHQRQVMNQVIMPHLLSGTRKAAAFVEGEIKKDINRGQTTRAGAGGVRVGLDPSKPGEPPKKVTARLFQSINHRVERKGFKITGFVSAGTKYAAILELGKKGFVKRPGHWRRMDQAFGKPITPRSVLVKQTFVNLDFAARPFIRKAVMNNQPRIRQLILAG